MTNCINCGAILHGDKCEYCGTTYSDEKVYAEFKPNDCVGIMKLGDEEINVYISNMESNVIFQDPTYRDANGILHRGEAKILRKFTVIEM